MFYMECLYRTCYSKCFTRTFGSLVHLSWPGFIIILNRSRKYLFSLHVGSLKILIGRGAKVLKTNILLLEFPEGVGVQSKNPLWGQYRYFLEQNNLFSWLFLSFKGSLPKVADKCSFCTFLYILLFRLHNVTVNILFSADNLFCFSLPWDLHLPDKMIIYSQQRR